MIIKCQNLGKERFVELPLKQSKMDALIAIQSKSELTDEDIELLGWWEDFFWEIRDYLFKKMMLEPLKNEAYEFLKKIHLYEFDLKEEYKGTKFNVIDVYYNSYDNQIYVFAQPVNQFYPNQDEMIKNRLEVRLDYRSSELEDILKTLLEITGEDYEEWEENYGDLVMADLEIGDLFWDFIHDCWIRSKEETNSNILGFLSYASGGGTVNLDDGEDMDAEGAVQKLIKMKNISI